MCTDFKPAERDGQTIGGESFGPGSTGVPVLENTPAFLEYKVVSFVEAGDHSLFVGEVMEAEVTEIPKGRADDVTLWLNKNLEKRYFMGGTAGPQDI